jgi:hypothetical protein
MEVVFAPPKRFKRAGLALLGSDSVGFELFLDDLFETVVECSFLVFRCPTVSLMGSTQDTSNIVAAS